ncbi:MAG: NADH-quinone oxidoreductase subunit A [Candidatus Omnitrophica bacterium]|nr:NADH-quinone oxidoreductase subunit A [Candidatus Omnitrophota bacterium]
MEKPGEYLGLLAVVLFSGAVVVLIVLLNRWLGPKHKTTPVKAEPFECGMTPFQSPAKPFPVKFYLLAMLFILIDVEIVWLFPWAVVLKVLKWPGIAAMFSFLLVLILGFIYAWKKGALEWER